MTTTTKQDLPPGVVALDLKYPEYDSNDKPAYDVADHGQRAAGNYSWRWNS